MTFGLSSGMQSPKDRGRTQQIPRFGRPGRIFGVRGQRGQNNGLWAELSRTVRPSPEDAANRRQTKEGTPDGFGT